jgi:tRNA pseudouridine32 synthase / 23S rRNA pseudouridine746 synthase
MNDEDMTEGLARLSPYAPPVDAGLDIVCQDDHLLVINKPAGLLAVPGRAADLSDCALFRVQKQFPQALLVHRLDEATSGLLLFALNPAAQKAASWAFESRQVKKNYTACVHGLIREDEGVINAPIAKDWPRRPMHIVDPVHGKSAITAWRVISRDQQRLQTLVELDPQSGRTHQLRVHMQHMGHPILGDRLYGVNFETEPRLMLHACGLQMTHPLKPDTMLDLHCKANF